MTNGKQEPNGTLPYVDCFSQACSYTYAVGVASGRALALQHYVLPLRGCVAGIDTMEIVLRHWVFALHARVLYHASNSARLSYAHLRGS
jgi:hypothetical protein